MSEEPVLQVEGLIKTYGTFCAVNEISFSVPRGAVIGLLGPNGAGKTTTIQVLLGVTLSNGGTIRYFGMDFARHRQACLQRINFASSFNNLQGRISVFENLLVYADLYSVGNAKQKIRELAEMLEITDLLYKKYWDLSQGQQTRANIVKALLNDPELLLFDEPTASLDPDIADKLLSLIEQLRLQRKLSILYTSHDMAEVTRICDEVIFLDRGKIVAHDTPEGLTRTIDYAHLIVEFQGERENVEKVIQRFSPEYSFTDEHYISAKVDRDNLPKVIFNLSQAGVWLKDISIKKPTLDDVFMHIARGTYDLASKN
jgi:ABC-2 type transport system ATP-binding protein